MNIDDLLVEVRGPDGVRAGQLSADDLVGAEFTPRLNDVGDWSVELPHEAVSDSGEVREHELCRLLRTAEAGLIVTGPGGVILSGPMNHAQFVASTKDPGGTWVISGFSDLIYVDDGLAYGDPSKYELATQGAANDTRTAVAESLVLDYISRNIGPRAVSQRRRPALTIAQDLGRGPVVKKTPRFQPLLELSQEILLGTALSVDAVQVGAAIQVQIIEAVDRSSDIRLDFANDQVVRTEYEYSGPGLTDVIVAGQGEGTARTMIRRTTTAPKWGRRRERFIDKRNTDDLVELTQAGDEELADDEAERTAFKVIPNTDLDLTYGVDWRVGDIVSVVIAGEEIPVPVVTAPIKVTADGVLVGATVGSPIGTKWEDRVDIRQQRQERRISALERSL